MTEVVQWHFYPFYGHIQMDSTVHAITEFANIHISSIIVLEVLFASRLNLRPAERIELSAKICYDLTA